MQPGPFPTRNGAGDEVIYSKVASMWRAYVYILYAHVMATTEVCHFDYVHVFSRLSSN